MIGPLAPPAYARATARQAKSGQIKVNQGKKSEDEDEDEDDSPQSDWVDRGTASTLHRCRSLPDGVRAGRAIGLQVESCRFGTVSREGCEGSEGPLIHFFGENEPNNPA